MLVFYAKTINLFDEDESDIENGFNTIVCDPEGVSIGPKNTNILIHKYSNFYLFNQECPDADNKYEQIERVTACEFSLYFHIYFNDNINLNSPNITCKNGVISKSDKTKRLEEYYQNNNNFEIL